MLTDAGEELNNQKIQNFVMPPKKRAIQGRSASGGEKKKEVKMEESFQERTSHIEGNVDVPRSKRKRSDEKLIDSEEETIIVSSSQIDSTIQNHLYSEAVSSSNSSVYHSPPTTRLNSKTRITPDGTLYIWKCAFCTSWSSTTSMISEHVRLMHMSKPKYVGYLRDRVRQLCKDGVLDENGEIFSASQGIHVQALKDKMIHATNSQVKPESCVAEQRVTSTDNSDTAKSDSEDNSYHVYVYRDEKSNVNKEDMTSNYVDDNLPLTFVKSDSCHADSDGENASAETTDFDSCVKQ